VGNLPTLKPREVVALLSGLGFSEVRQRGSHKQFRHADGRATTVPFHPGRDISPTPYCRATPGAFVIGGRPNNALKLTARRFRQGSVQAESDDVVAALDYLKTVPWVDASRIGIMGSSFGGIVSVFTARRGDHFLAVVDQAGGALTWSRSRELQSALPDAARRIRVPILCMAAENDATTASVKSLCEAARSHGSSAMLTIYPPFTPRQPAMNIAPGHLLFSVQGVSQWGRDVVTFLDQHRPR
jgi:predicted RNA binding protein YcfA (HicA-like mRNA interferase family)